MEGICKSFIFVQRSIVVANLKLASCVCVSMQLTGNDIQPLAYRQSTLQSNFFKKCFLESFVFFITKFL